MKSIGIQYETQKKKKQNLIKRFFHQMKRFEDKYLVGGPNSHSQERLSKQESSSSDPNNVDRLSTGGGSIKPGCLGGQGTPL